MILICEHCRSNNVEKRGTREAENEEYIRLKCNACGKWSQVQLNYETIPTFERSQKEVEKLLQSECYIVTSAQNNTPIDKQFWGAIQRYAEYKKAQIIVIPVLYRNPTSPDELISKEAWWPPEITPYLIQNDLKIGEHIRIIGDAYIAATAVNPLTGFESLTGPNSAIFGHAQIQMRTVATPQNRLPKILHTTGSISIKNYSKSKAGKKGAFHHSLGFVIVEVDKEEKLFHLRGVVGDKNSEFYDLNLHVTSRKIEESKAEAIVLGDEHVIVNCPDVREATFGQGGIVETIKPKYIVRHDIIDSYSISHHHRNQPSIKYKKHFEKVDRLEDEMKASARYIEETTPKNSISVIVPSNHHNHITRWLEEIDWKSEPWNAKIYHELWAAWLFAIETKQEKWHPFVWWMQQNCKAEAIYLQDDYPFIVKGIYLGYHGDRGSNGSKGNLNSFAKIGAKTVIAHVHWPGIEKGAYQVGTSTKLQVDYTKGPSSWLNTHCIIHPNGKRQLVNIIYGDWRYNT